jgi:hypothetical protein
MLPPRLARELEELGSAWSSEVHEEECFFNVQFKDFPTGPAYSQPKTTILLRVPRAYPDAGLDMFWTDATLVLAAGGTPRNADSIEAYCGRSWRRFSWHPARWDPARDNLWSYLEFVRRRFRDD